MVHYRVHIRNPLFPILSQMKPVDTTPPYFSKIHLNVIIPFRTLLQMFLRDILPPYTEYLEDRDRGSYKMLAPIYQTIRRHTPEVRNINNQCCDHLKFHKPHRCYLKPGKYTDITTITYYSKVLFPLTYVKINLNHDEDGDKLVETC
jgi:hypothetical protein